MMASYHLENRSGFWRLGEIYVRKDETGEFVYEEPDADLVTGVIETLAGRPVVLATDVGGDDVENSGCGRTVRSNQPRIMAEAVLELCRLSDSDRHAMGLRGKRYAEDNLSTVDLADRLNDVLVSAAASRT